jgi:uncharacterized protein (TIGR03083 family)
MSTLDSLDRALDRVADLIATTPAAAPAIGRWTAREVAAHVAGGLELYTQLVRGGTSPAGTIDAITPLNDEIIASIDELHMPALAERVRRSAAVYRVAATVAGGAPDVGWHAGLRVPLSTLLAISLGEAIVHGRDIARAGGRPWPVPPDWARTVFEGVLPVLPHYLLPERAVGRACTFDIRLRGRPPVGAVWAIADGHLTVSPAPGRVDCHISADPWAFIQILYGRTGPVRPALSGRILAWGGRPWLAFLLPSLFRSP